MLSSEMREKTQQPTRIEEPDALCIREHAEACYPLECCGLLFDDGVRPCTDVQDDLHDRDPEAFPRTSRHAFRLSDADQLLLARSIDGPVPARVLYHSHVDADAYFSAADLAGATLDGEPLYPGLLHLVVSVRDGVAGEMALFRLSPTGAEEVWRGG